jgi:CheY-like chemotaxis protein
MAKTLLLADDSVTIQKVVGISFASEDISITTVDNGDDALIKAKELRPDVVLADVVMPGKSGYEVCEAIKADPELRHIPVLLLTGTFEAFDDERAARIGAAGHVAKPFEAQTLVDRVKQLLGRAPEPAAPEPAMPEPESVASSADDSFDFFDDGLSNESSRDTAIDGATPDSPLEDSLSMESADAAFAFGDDDLGDQTPPTTTPDATIAMMPDEAPGLETSPAEPSADPALTTVDTSMLDAAAEPPPAAPSEPPALADEAFDFESQTEPPAPPAPPEPPPLPESPPPPPTAAEPVELAEPENLAQATILDPKLGSSFAVSSSDLDSTFSSAPEAPAEASEESQTPAAPPLPAAPMPELDAEPLSSDLLGVEPMLEPAGEEPLASTVDEAEDAVGAAPAEFLDAEPADIAAASPEPVPMAPLPGSEPPASDFMAAAEPAAPPAAAESPEAIPSVDQLTEQIAPALRVELHETLEKIAWESFGQMTDRIVQEVIQRVETVAWDVVPKLAEALIQEEIRKLKGEPE